MRDSLFESGYLFTIQMRERAVLKLLASHGYGDLQAARVLDVGTGTGTWLRDFVRWGAEPSHLFGVDRDGERVAMARRFCPASVTLECGDAAQLGYGDGMFDIVVQSTLFSSVPERERRRAIAGEMVRVRKPGGLILWYDMRVNNPWNRKVRGIGKAELRALFPGERIAARRITLAPPVARRVAWGASILNGLAPLRTHYLAAIRSERSRSER